MLHIQSRFLCYSSYSRAYLLGVCSKANLSCSIVTKWIKLLEYVFYIHYFPLSEAPLKIYPLRIDFILQMNLETASLWWGLHSRIMSSIHVQLNQCLMDRQWFVLRHDNLVTLFRRQFLKDHDSPSFPRTHLKKRLLVSCKKVYWTSWTC